MKIVIKTKVKKEHKAVFANFNESLFLELKPPLLPLQLKRFDGCKKGDEVHLTIGSGWFSQDWNARIVEQLETETEIFFIDEGIKLPFFLKEWRHRHRILKEEKGSIIVDDIFYKTPFWGFDYLIYPILYLQFWVRKPVYRKVFG